MRVLILACFFAVAVFTGVAGAGTAQVTTLAVGVGPTAVAVDSTRNLVFVLSQRSNTIGVIDGSTRATVATITRPPGGRGVALALDPASGRLYDLDTVLSQVLVWDEKTHALLTRWPVPAAAHGVAVDPAQNRVYVTSAVSGVGYFTAFDATSGARIISRVVGTDPRGLAVDPTTGLAWVADAATQVVYVVDPKLALEVNFFPIADGAFAVAIDPRVGARRVWVGGGRGVTVILPDKNMAAGTAGTGGPAMSVAIDTTTGRGYAVTAASTPSTQGTLSVLQQANTGVPTVVERVPVGVSPLGVGVDLYNSRVFVANAGADPDPGSVNVASEFQPLTHGFHFANRFAAKKRGVFDLAATPFGLSGGMVYAALDTFNLGWRTPPDTTPPAVGSVREYISRREVDGLGALSAALVKRFHLWQSYPGTGPAGLPQRSLAEFTRALRPKLDKGVPVPVGVVLATEGRPVWENREVLATGYFRKGSQYVLELYDPALPNRTAYLFTTTRRETLQSNGQGQVGKPWRGFFAISTYKLATPPWPPTAN